MSAFSDKIEAKYPGGQWRTVRGHKVYFHDGKAVPESLPADWGGKSTAEKPPSAKKPSTAKGKEPTATSLLGLLDSHKRRGRVAAKPSAKKPSTVASKYGVGESVLYQFPSGEWGPAVVKRVTKNHEAVLGGFRGASKVRVTIPLDSPLLKPVADAAKSSPNTKKLVEAQADRDRAVRDHAAAVAKAKAAEKPATDGDDNMLDRAVLQRLHNERNGSGLDIFKPFGPHNRHISGQKWMNTAADLNAAMEHYAGVHGADSAEMPGIAAALMLRYEHDTGAKLANVYFPTKPLKGQLRKSQRLLHVILVKEVRS